MFLEGFCERIFWKKCHAGMYVGTPVQNGIIPAQNTSEGFQSGQDLAVLCTKRREWGEMRKVLGSNYCEKFGNHADVHMSFIVGCLE